MFRTFITIHTLTKTLTGYLCAVIISSTKTQYTYKLNAQSQMFGYDVTSYGSVERRAGE